MILSTTPSLETHKIKKYLGIVSSGRALYTASSTFQEVIDSFKDLGATTFNRTIEEGRKIVMDHIVEQAQALNADAVVGLSLDYEFTGSSLLVAATGTAVKFE